MRAFLTAHGATAFTIGIHSVLLAWLGVSELGLSASQMGWIQFAALFPNVFLVLIAGVCADKYRATYILAFASLLQVLCLTYLFFCLKNQSLDFYSLAVYALSMGSVNAFIGPVREKVLTDLADSNIQRKISSASLVQFSLQSFGIFIASFSESTGLVELVLVQILALALAFLSLSSIITLQSKTKNSPNINALQSLKAGFVTFFENRALKHLLVLIGFNGFMHMGVFLVAVPVVSRDSYGLSAMEYGLLQLTFSIGMISAYLHLRLKKSRVQYPGHTALFSLLYTAFTGFAFSMQPTLTGLYLMIAFWGWVAGNSAAHCRMVLQVAVWQEVRGRAMAIYQFVLFGAAPLGALCMGYLLKPFGVEKLFLAMSAASILLFLVFLMKRPLWQLKIDD